MFTFVTIHLVFCFVVFFTYACWHKKTLVEDEGLFIYC